MMLQHEFTKKEKLRLSGDGGDEDKGCWGVSLPSVVSGGSDTFVIDSTTVSKQRRTILENFKMLSYSRLFPSWISAHLILLGICIIFLQLGQWI